MEMRVYMGKDNIYISLCGNSIIFLYKLMHDIIFDPSVYVPSTLKRWSGVFLPGPAV